MAEPIVMFAAGTGATPAEREWELKEAAEWELFLVAFRYSIKFQLAQAEEEAAWPNEGKVADGSTPEYRWPYLARLKKMRQMLEHVESIAARQFVERHWRKEVKTLPPAEWSEETLWSESISIDHEKDKNPERIEKWEAAYNFREENGRMTREWASADVPWTRPYT